MTSEKSADGAELGMDAVCRFSGHLAHELNNLLTPIIACGQMLCDGISKNDPLYFCAEQIADAGERCLGLSRKLQIIGSRRTSGHVMDITSLVQDVLHSVVLPSDRTIVIEEELAKTSSAGSLLVKVDMEQFRFLINELIANAVDAMPQGGSIRINVEVAEPSETGGASGGARGWVAVAVQDEGTGMTPDIVARMYEPYFSSHGQERDKGLGLTLVYGIVRRTGGVIECDTSPGAGTTFRVYFPLQMEAGAA